VRATILAALASIALVATAHADLRVLAEDGSGVTLELIPDELELVACADPAGGRRPSFAALQAVAEPGAPWLPVRRLLLALPALEAPRVEILDLRTRVLPGVDVAPVPDGALGPRSKSESPATWSRDAGAYQAARARPWARFAPPGRQRGIAVAPLTLSAARLHAEGLEIVTRLLVRVDFAHPAGAASPAPSGDRRWDALRSAALLNWRSARRFPALPAPALRRSAAAAAAETPWDQSDRWLRLDIDHDAVYAVRPADFDLAGLDPDAVDPASLRLFARPPTPLPEDLDEDPVPYVEIPALLEDDGDALFEAGERLIFFGAQVEAADDGLDTFGRPHPFAHRNRYWVTWGWGVEGEPLRAAAADHLPRGGETRHTSARRIVHRELERLTAFSWGSAWYWDLQVGSGEVTHAYDIELPRVLESGLVRLRVAEIGKTGTNHQVRIALNDPGETLGEESWGGLLEKTIEGERGTGPTSEANQVLVTVVRDPGSSADQLYLDWIELEYQADLDAGGRDQWDFIVERSPGDEPWVTALSGLSTSASWVWEITDPTAPVLLDVAATATGAELRFDQEGRRRLIVAATPDSFVAVAAHTPARLRDPARGADWIVVTNAEMDPEAQRLAAYRRGRGLRAAVVDIDDIYVEFAAGAPDPTALRNFLHAAYHGWQSPAPAYVLLLGDGTFDVKNNSGYSEHRHVVPSYQTFASRYASNVDALDGWFAEVEGDDRVQDMMIGRLCVRSRDSAAEVVDKILRYESGADLGPWRMKAVLVADDERNPDYDFFGETVHTRDSERLAEQALPSWMAVERLYLVDHLLDDREKPSARDAIVDAFDTGMLVINYLGHGNQIQWAHENVFRSTRDIPLLANEGRWPLVLAGSCTVGRFDLDGSDSMAEDLTRPYDRGAIAMVAATRPTYSDPNFRMMRTLMQELFHEQNRGAGLDLGAAHLAARLYEGNGRNEKLNHLFADPALRLAIPAHLALIDSVPDPLEPLQTLHISGTAVSAADSSMVAAEGVVDLVVRESAFDEIYTIPSLQWRMPFERAGELIFQGQAELRAGRFEADLVVPRGFRSGARGAVHAYLRLDDGADGSGVRRDLDYSGQPLRIDALEALYPVDPEAGAHAERGWGWHDSVVDQEAAAGAPDGVAAEIGVGAWIGLDFDGGPQDETITDGVGNGPGPDLRVHQLDAAPSAVYGSSNAVDWRYLGVVEGTGELAIDDLIHKARYVRLYTTVPDTVPVDANPPQIRVFAAGREVGAGGVILGRGNPLTFVVDDPQGIALLPGMQRGVTLRLETLGSTGNVSGIEEFDLGSSFTYDRGSHRRGRVRFVLDKPAGDYVLILSASDNTGARASTEIDATVRAGLAVVDLKSYPNPFSKRTWITWRGSAQGSARVKIYTVTGRLIRVLEAQTDPSLEGYGFVEWDGTDQDRDPVANGVYLFRVELSSTTTREKADGLGRIVVMR